MIRLECLGLQTLNHLNSIAFSFLLIIVYSERHKILEALCTESSAVFYWKFLFTSYDTLFISISCVWFEVCKSVNACGYKKSQGKLL
jgi:hypothetical protein